MQLVSRVSSLRSSVNRITSNKYAQADPTPNEIVIYNTLLKNKNKLNFDNSQESTNFGYTRIINGMLRKSELTSSNLNELPMLQAHQSNPITQNYQFQNKKVKVLIEQNSNNILPIVTNQESNKKYQDPSYFNKMDNLKKRQKHRRITELLKINKLYQMNDQQKVSIKAQSDGQVISQQIIQKILEEERQLQDIVFLSS
eukprot:403346937